MLIVEKVIISAKYSEFLDIFSKKAVAKLSKRLNINKYTINLKPGKQLFYRPIYSLDLIELKTFKTCIKNNLANAFDWPLKSSARAPILFLQKPDSSFRLCIDY